MEVRVGWWWEFVANIGVSGVAEAREVEVGGRVCTVEV